MHELSLARELIEQVVDIAVRETAVGIDRIVVAIGALAGIECDAFEWAFPFAAEGTLAEGADLAIEKVQARAICRACNTCFEPEILNMTCPACESPHTTLQGGREFLIRSMDLEVEGSDQS